MKLNSICCMITICLSPLICLADSTPYDDVVLPNTKLVVLDPKKNDFDIISPQSPLPDKQKKSITNNELQLSQNKKNILQKSSITNNTAKIIKSSSKAALQQTQKPDKPHHALAKKTPLTKLDPKLIWLTPQQAEKLTSTKIKSLAKKQEPQVIKFKVKFLT